MTAAQMSDDELKPVKIAIAVVEKDDRFLVGTRPPGVPLAGSSEFPGGKIEPSETPEAAAVRECLEETGIAVEVTGQYPRYVHDYSFGIVELHFFACRVTAPDQTPTPPFTWVPRAELARLKFPSGNSTLVSMLVKSVR